MKKYHVPATKSSPEIILDPDNHKLEFRGESYPEHCARFYGPVFDWLDQFLATTNAPIQVNMEILYFNSSSSKAFMDLFDTLDAAALSGKSITVNWLYHEENEMAQECGEEFQEDVMHLDFKLKAIDS